MAVKGFTDDSREKLADAQATPSSQRTLQELWSRWVHPVWAGLRLWGFASFFGCAGHWNGRHREMRGEGVNRPDMCQDKKKG